MLLHPALHQHDYVLHKGEPGCHACFSADPRFWDLAARDLRLRPSSPAIDAGLPDRPWNPNALASFCTPEAFNLSNALEIAQP